MRLEAWFTALLAYVAGLKHALVDAFERGFLLADSLEPQVEAYLSKKLGLDRLDSGTARYAVASQTETIITVLVLGILIAVGVLIYSEMLNAAFGDVGNSSNNDQLENTTSNATETFGDAMELAPIIMIVLIAAVILGVVQRFR